MNCLVLTEDLNDYDEERVKYDQPAMCAELNTSFPWCFTGDTNEENDDHFVIRRTEDSIAPMRVDTDVRRSLSTPLPKMARMSSGLRASGSLPLEEKPKRPTVPSVARIALLGTGCDAVINRWSLQNDSSRRRTNLRLITKGYALNLVLNQYYKRPDNEDDAAIALRAYAGIVIVCDATVSKSIADAYEWIDLLQASSIPIVLLVNDFAKQSAILRITLARKLDTLSNPNCPENDIKWFPFDQLNDDLQPLTHLADLMLSQGSLERHSRPSVSMTNSTPNAVSMNKKMNSYQTTSTHLMKVGASPTDSGRHQTRFMKRIMRNSSPHRNQPHPIGIASS